MKASIDNNELTDHYHVLELTHQERLHSLLLQLDVLNDNEADFELV
jgi:hypothetical protein